MNLILAALNKLPSQTKGSGKLPNDPKREVPGLYPNQNSSGCVVDVCFSPYRWKPGTVFRLARPVPCVGAQADPVLPLPPPGAGQTSDTLRGTSAQPVLQKRHSAKKGLFPLLTQKLRDQVRNPGSSETSRTLPPISTGPAFHPESLLCCWVRR